MSDVDSSTLANPGGYWGSPLQGCTPLSLASTLRLENSQLNVLSSRLQQPSQGISSSDDILHIFDTEIVDVSQIESRQEEPFTLRSSKYLVDRYFLNGTQINELMRACLNDWLMGAAEEHYFSRETYALASYYIDTYLSRKRTISKNDLQLVGFTALFLASKMQESHTLKTLPHHLSKQSVYSLELDMCIKLQYRLSIDTYVYWLTNLMVRWDAFVFGNARYQHVNYLQPNSQSYTRYTTMFQLADCMNLDCVSFEFERKHLMFNLFCVVNYRNVRLWDNYPTSKEKLLRQLLSDGDYLSDMTECMRAIVSEIGTVDCSIMEYIFDFLSLQINLSEPSCASQLYSQFLSQQTHNSKMFGLMKTIVASRRFK